MGRFVYSRTRPPDLSNAPRCEAWLPRQPNQSKPPAPCPNTGPFKRNGHRVCMLHKTSQQVAFDATAAEHLPPRRR